VSAAIHPAEMRERKVRLALDNVHQATVYALTEGAELIPQPLRGDLELLADTLGPLLNPTQEVPTQ
jgi:hypothetical protein